MPFFNVDDGFGDSKPVMAMPDRNRLAAVGLWTLSGAWSAKELTDGHVPLAVLKKLGAKPVLIDILTTSEHALWVPGQSEIVFRDWEVWQETKAKTLAKRAKWAGDKRGQRGRYRARDTSENGQTSTTDTPPDTRQCPPQTPPPPIPIPIPEPEPSEGTSSVGVTSLNANGAHTPLPKFCPRHPHGTPERCGDCANIRKANEARQRDTEQAEAAQALAAVNARQTEIAQRAACRQCDTAGWLLGDNGEPVDPATRCTHPKLTEAHRV